VAKPIYVLNGPNLDRLGTREPDLYGRTTLAEVEAICRKAAGGRPIEFRQSNAEFQLVEWIHEAIDRGAGIVINPAGLTFTSVPIYDALKMFPGPVFELHITNVYRREAVYHHSLVSKVATAVIMGLGPDGYRAAVEAMARRLAAGTRQRGRRGRR
jgi:3-dehydroquinate dehydratase-2